jgi:hypothetical protein
MTDNIVAFPPPKPTRDSDEDTIENRRVQRMTHSNGFDYDPTTASRQWVIEREGRASFWGVALYLNVYGRYFVHRYGQWDRLCSVEPGVEAAIKATTEYAPHLLRPIFGNLREEGEGEAYTPLP